MQSFLQLWCLLGTCTLIVSTIRLHRRGSSLRQICAIHRELAAEGGPSASLNRLFGYRPAVIIFTIGVFPFIWAVAIADRIKRPGR